MASSSSLYIPGVTTVPYQCTPGPEEEVIATILRKLFAGLSVLGSGFIIVTLVQKWRRSPNSIDPYCRIMLGLSVYDIIWSFFPWFLGSWLMPVETGHWGASGNTQTCTLQGFFFWLGVPGAQYYQILLSLHTLLLVTFRWTPHEFHHRVERWSHVVVFAIALVLATVPLFFQGYNPECGTCLPAPLPIWCGDWIFWGDGETECLRGSPALSQSYYTIYLTNLSIMGVFCTYAMIQVYWTVRRQEDRNSRYATFQPSASHREKSRRIRRTMILYTFGFYLCWIVPSFIIHFAKQGTPMMRMSYILLPFQGFFNMIIFLAPKCAKHQKQHPGTWLIMAYFYVIFGSCSVKDCWQRIQGSERMAAIRRSSSRIRNPFNASSQRLGDTQITEMLSHGAFDDDDGIGFNDFNVESSRPVPLDTSAEQEEEGAKQKVDLSSAEEEEDGDLHTKDIQDSSIILKEDTKSSTGDDERYDLIKHDDSSESRTKNEPPENDEAFVPEKLEGKVMGNQRRGALDDAIQEPHTERTEPDTERTSDAGQAEEGLGRNDSSDGGDQESTDPNAQTQPHDGNTQGRRSRMEGTEEAEKSQSAL